MEQAAPKVRISQSHGTDLPWPTKDAKKTEETGQVFLIAI